MNIAKAANMCEVGGRDGRGGMTDRCLQLVLLQAEMHDRYTLTYVDVCWRMLALQAEMDDRGAWRPRHQHHYRRRRSPLCHAPPVYILHYVKIYWML
jgi:hypothetical protein